MNLAVREHRIVIHDGARIVLTGDIVRGQNTGDTWRLSTCRYVNGDNPRMCAFAHCGVNLERAGKLRHIIDVDRFTGDMPRRAVMRDCTGDAATNFVVVWRRLMWHRGDRAG